MAERLPTCSRFRAYFLRTGTPRKTCNSEVKFHSFIRILCPKYIFFGPSVWGPVNSETQNFSTTPLGRHTLRPCHSIACQGGIHRISTSTQPSGGILDITAKGMSAARELPSIVFGATGVVGDAIVRLLSEKATGTSNAAVVTAGKVCSTLRTLRFQQRELQKLGVAPAA